MNDTEWANYLASLSNQDRGLAQAIVNRIWPELDQIKQVLAQARFDIGVGDRRSDGNSARVTEAHTRIGNLSERVHHLQDLFEPGGSFAELERVVWQLAADLEALKQAKAAGDER